MIVPTTVDKGVGPHLATVAADEKYGSRRLVLVPIFSENYGDSENPSPDKQRQRGGAILKGVAMTTWKILKCLNQRKIGMVTIFGWWWWGGGGGGEISNIDALKLLSKGAGHF